MKYILHAILAAGVVGTHVWADSGHVHTRGAGSSPSANAPTSLTEGEVRRVDRAQGRVTLRHGPIESLNMPPMTMVFRVQDPAWLEGLNPGDVIRFQAERINGAYTVTHLEKLQQAGR
ncbi:MAG: copper-binding protein [Thiobacillaceae bacterium]